MIPPKHSKQKSKNSFVLPSKSQERKPVAKMRRSGTIPDNLLKVTSKDKYNFNPTVVEE
jgi:hypothetical protein